MTNTNTDNYLFVIVREFVLDRGMNEYREVVNGYTFYDREVLGFASDGNGSLTVIMTNGSIKGFGGSFIESFTVTDYIWFARKTAEADTLLHRAVYG